MHESKMSNRTLFSSSPFWSLQLIWEISQQKYFSSFAEWWMHMLTDFAFYYYYWGHRTAWIIYFAYFILSRWNNKIVCSLNAETSIWILFKISLLISPYCRLCYYRQRVVLFESNPDDDTSYLLIAKFDLHYLDEF